MTKCFPCGKSVVWGTFLNDLRKQQAFCDAITGFPIEWCQRNECRSSVLITCHNPNLHNYYFGKFALTSENIFSHTNHRQKHYSDLGSDTSVWNFYTRSSDIILQENQWWYTKMGSCLSSVYFYRAQVAQVHIAMPCKYFANNQLKLLPSEIPVSWEVYSCSGSNSELGWPVGRQKMTHLAHGQWSGL